MPETPKATEATVWDLLRASPWRSNGGALTLVGKAADDIHAEILASFTAVIELQALTWATTECDAEHASMQGDLLLQTTACLPSSLWLKALDAVPPALQPVLDLTAARVASTKDACARDTILLQELVQCQKWMERVRRQAAGSSAQDPDFTGLLYWRDVWLSMHNAGKRKATQDESSSSLERLALAQIRDANPTEMQHSDEKDEEAQQAQSPLQNAGVLAALKNALFMAQDLFLGTPDAEDKAQALLQRVLDKSFMREHHAALQKAVKPLTLSEAVAEAAAMPVLRVKLDAFAVRSAVEVAADAWRMSSFRASELWMHASLQRAEQGILSLLRILVGYGRGMGKAPLLALVQDLRRHWAKHLSPKFCDLLLQDAVAVIMRQCL